MKLSGLMQKIPFFFYTPAEAQESQRYLEFLYLKLGDSYPTCLCHIQTYVFLKGVLHTTGGYMVYTATTFKYAFDYKPSDVYW